MVHLMPGSEVPEDLEAFFGHPLVPGIVSSNSSLALLHEYKSLPAIGETSSVNNSDSLSSSNEESNEQTYLEIGKRLPSPGSSPDQTKLSPNVYGETSSRTSSPEDQIIRANYEQTNDSPFSIYCEGHRIFTDPTDSQNQISSYGLRFTSLNDLNDLESPPNLDGQTSSSSSSRTQSPSNITKVLNFADLDVIGRSIQECDTLQLLAAIDEQSINQNSQEDFKQSPASQLDCYISTSPNQSPSSSLSSNPNSDSSYESCLHLDSVSSSHRNSLDGQEVTATCEASILPVAEIKAEPLTSQHIGQSTPASLRLQTTYNQNNSLNTGTPLIVMSTNTTTESTSISQMLFPVCSTVTETVTIPGKGQFICNAEIKGGQVDLRSIGLLPNAGGLPPRMMMPHHHMMVSAGQHMVPVYPTLHPHPQMQFRHPVRPHDMKMMPQYMARPQPMHPDMFMLRPWQPRYHSPQQVAVSESLPMPRFPYQSQPKTNQLLSEMRNRQNQIQQSTSDSTELSPPLITPMFVPMLGPGMQSVMHLKSPDSGFGDVNNNDRSNGSPSLSELTSSNPESPEPQNGGTRKRKNVSGSYSRQHSNKANKDSEADHYPKRDNDETGFDLELDAATSSCAKLKDDRMTYLNKGQTYTLTLQNTLHAASHKSSFVKTTVTLRMRAADDEQVGLWRHWCLYLRQTGEDEGMSALDADGINATGISEGSLSALGVNAFSFAWDTHDTVKIPIQVHCLSTDFCQQKGVKGKSIHIQVDTYDSTSRTPVHRAFAQCKVFCDKGAERKARDEEKKRNLDSTKLEDHHSPCPTTRFYSMSDLHTEPYIHNIHHNLLSHLEGPVMDSLIMTESSPMKPQMSLRADGKLPEYYENMEPSAKKFAFNDVIGTDLPRWIYIKEESDKFYTHLELLHPTVEGFVNAINKKFLQNVEYTELVKQIKNNGILVELDDNVIRCLPNESAYVLRYEKLHDSSLRVILFETH